MMSNETVTSLVSKCQWGATCLCLDQCHNLAPKEGQGRQGSCIVPPHPGIATN